MTVATNYPVTPPATSPLYEHYVDRKAGEGDSIMSQGISVLYKFMVLFNDLAQFKYDQMSAKADRARDSQQMANQVDAVISQLTKAEDKGRLPNEVSAYLRDRKIPITVQSDGRNSTSNIESHLTQLGVRNHAAANLNKGQLDVIRGALESDAGRCSDFVTQAQLHIQKIMQSYNTSVTMINSMQTLLSEMNKSIAQNIR
ncbi:Secreted effector protein SseB [Burkholderia lata]|uniref:secretion protein EspA n=1 Tax=Burkholderia lata (strain ATCC 17760 / DSM 23089 / LMG 22485 / NCIMB 9086 / R18194 / 383) TaxID=482957 RepID=UPI001454228A|nr:secretion protein EspA [Burkholderia lata]VWD65036.1 Secreted effector protein SseB [Burkholderia lata]